MTKKRGLTLLLFGMSLWLLTGNQVIKADDTTPAQVRQTSFRLVTPDSPLPKYELKLHVDNGAFATDLADYPMDELEFSKNFKQTNDVNVQLENAGTDATITFLVTPDQSTERLDKGTIKIKGEVIRTYKARAVAKQVTNKAVFGTGQTTAQTFGITPPMKQIGNAVRGESQFDNTIHKNVAFDEIDTYQPAIYYQPGENDGTGVTGKITFDKNGKPMLKDCANTAFLAIADGLKEAWKQRDKSAGGTVGLAKLMCLGGPFGDALDMLLTIISGPQKDVYMEKLNDISKQIDGLKEQMNSVFNAIRDATEKAAYKDEINQFLSVKELNLNISSVKIPIKNMYDTINSSGILTKSAADLSPRDLEELRKVAHSVFANATVDLLGNESGSNYYVLDQFEKFSKVASGEVSVDNNNIFKTFAAYESLKYNYNTQYFAERRQFDESLKAMYLYYYFPVTFSIAFDAYDEGEQIISANQAIQKCRDLLNGQNHSKLSQRDKENLATAIAYLESKVKTLERNVNNDKVMLGDYGTNTPTNPTSNSVGPGNLFDLMKSKKLMAKLYGTEIDDPSITSELVPGHGHLSAEETNAKQGLVFANRIHKYIGKNPVTYLGQHIAIASIVNNTNSYKKVDGSYCTANCSADCYRDVHSPLNLSNEDIKNLALNAKPSKTIYSELSAAGVNVNGFVWTNKAQDESVGSGFMRAPDFKASIWRINQTNNSEEKVQIYRQNFHYLNSKITDETNDFSKCVILQTGDVSKSGYVNHTPAYPY
ncbi:hypothetical protein H9L19_03125 [Weissella diestrammenae]|uniref:Uncharacterized protein n=1 Tax=Weissella diestrammenae TaxID=1162633 RepID=A0A7G9T6Y9_9LACO|nr:hypothetical protein [Weissella diestrammenae]MCM0582539.1 hypothetical protein [Weissella diestrammenae]QNN75864.1 hypothetical protein H9L19_03125 [Weissella diestrammenae]